MGKSKHQEYTEMALTGLDIELHIRKFSELDRILETVEPYGYKIKSISSYTGSKSNCTLYKDIQ